MFGQIITKFGQIHLFVYFLVGFGKSKYGHIVQNTTISALKHSQYTRHIVTYNIPET